ncbi:type II secretion system protein GspL [Pseudomonas sp. S75]|uniref:type II secretion system protein GspL n=1 Tax=unclassified Pseudomonas TaxID=196821 RepID=UPI0019074C42|nr:MULTISPECIES: type II secretion system protein GspL [unclassified Pseudomonas]MBJ9975506.1 type II secretion system protein GspL [Pseudomonas sp. S30]MBK0153057.1 type II secretion system protein GspL [Pseudomonas sp. S75]
MSLRIALPPLDGLTSDSPLAFALLDRHGRVSQTGLGTLATMQQTTGAHTVECFLHPLDSILSRVQLPPLGAARTQAAVACAAQTLVLGRPEQMHIAHSAGDADGHVAVSWLPRELVQRLGDELRRHQLKLLGLYPAPFRLPVPPNGSISACVMEGHLLLRHGPDQGAVEPQVQASLDALQTQGSRLLWYPDNTPAPALDAASAQVPWSGASPRWGLHAGVDKAPTAPVRWGKALACCALAIGVWLLALNLYAAREASEGLRLKRHMSQRVKQAFPELPVILNPLQQARQQLSARRNPTGADASADFASQVQHAASAMPFLAGTVQALVFEHATLHIDLSAEARGTTADDTWRATLAQAGIAAEATPNGWRLRSAEPHESETGAIRDDE